MYVSAQGVNVGDDSQEIGGTLHLGRHVRLVTAGSRRAYVFGVARGKVVFTGVTSLRGKALRRAVARLKLV